MKVLALVQFPLRLLGPLSFVVAVLAGLSAQIVEAAGRHIRAARFNPSGDTAAQHLSVEGTGRARTNQHVTTLGFSARAVAGCLAAGLPLLQPLSWADFGRLRFNAC